MWRRHRCGAATAKHRETGYVLLTVMGAMIPICGLTGLVVDTGYGTYMRRRAQAAADAGAKAAALQIAMGQTSSISSAVLQDTANNGFTNGTANVSVTVNYPPASGRYASNNNYAEVIVSKTIPTTFMSVLGISSMTVSARTVGGKGPGGGCVYIMNSAAGGAFNLSGSASLTATCGIYVNSGSSSALTVSGHACLSASLIEITGSYSNSSNCALNPTPDTGAATVPDPLANVQAPSFGSCDHTGFTATNGQTLSPGVYCNGITVPGGAIAYFNPGTYILLGGGLNVSGGSSISGAGVSFYNTYNGTYAYKPIVVSGGSQTNLSAPTSGALEGILFFQDRRVTSTSQNTVSGGSGAAFNGTLYFPTTPLVYSGGSNSAGAYTVIVADKLTLSGSSYVNNDYSSLSTGDPIKTGAILTE